MTELDYTDATAFPVFTSKAQILQAVLDEENHSRQGRFDLAARIANTNLAGITNAGAGEIHTLLASESGYGTA